LLKTIKAVYKNGRIEPMEEIDLAEGAEITVTVDTSQPPPEEERLERFLSSAGSWKGLVDEDFIDEIYRQRSLRTRSEVKL